jgi:hypothetical protein
MSLTRHSSAARAGCILFILIFYGLLKCRSRARLILELGFIIE